MIIKREIQSPIEQNICPLYLIVIPTSDRTPD